MPLSKTTYDHVAEEDHRNIQMATPAAKRGLFHRDEDFEDGIGFTAKYIGSQDVAQPHNRVEIVAAMRRIRFECKTRGKKRKVDLTISIRGVRVVLFKRNKKKSCVEGSLPILDHPIHRIFYVSHDSHDLLIFSYISREASSNLFCCNVFKAFKKSHALQVVRTIGQAFDVCHRLATEAELSDNEESRNNGDNKATTDNNAQPYSMTDVATGSAICPKSLDQIHTTAATQADSGHSSASSDVIRHAQMILASASYKPSVTSAGGATLAPQMVGTISSPMAPHPLTDDVAMGDGTLVTSRHQVQLFLQQQVALQSQQTHCLLSQMQLLKDQLAAETEARIEAQVRIHQLLMQNQELLEHIGVLVERLLQLEEPAGAKAELIQLPQAPLPMSKLTSSVCLSRLSLQRSHHVTSSSRLSAQNVSPDSGHRDMSSDSLSIGEATTTTTTTMQPSQSTATMRNNPLVQLGSSCSQQGMTSDLFRGRPSAAHSAGTTAAQTTTGHHGNVWGCCSLGLDASCAGHLLVAPPNASSVDASSSSVVSMSRFSRHVTTNQAAVGSLGNSMLRQNSDVEGTSDRRAIADGVVVGGGVVGGGGGNVEAIVNSNGWNRTSALSLHSQNSFGELRPPCHVTVVDSLARVNSSN